MFQQPLKAKRESKQIAEAPSEDQLGIIWDKSLNKCHTSRCQLVYPEGPILQPAKKLNQRLL